MLKGAPRSRKFPAFYVNYTSTAVFTKDRHQILPGASWNLSILYLSTPLIYIWVLPWLFFLLELWMAESILGPRGVAVMYWPIVPVPGDCEDGDLVEWNVVGRGNRSTRRKSAPAPFCPPQIPLARPGREPGRRSGKPATNRFSYGAACLDYTSPSNVPAMYFDIFLSPHACQISRPSHSSSLFTLNIRWKLHIKKLLILEFLFFYVQVFSFSENIQSNFFLWWEIVTHMHIYPI
jgi:hypothetical protein